MRVRPLFVAASRSPMPRSSAETLNLGVRLGNDPGVGLLDEISSTSEPACPFVITRVTRYDKIGSA